MDLIERNETARPHKIAYIDERGSYTFTDLAERTNRCANALTNLGLALETRILVCLLDTIDFPAVFLGAIKAGLVPVAVNTLLTGDDFDFMLRDSRAQALIVSEALLPVFKPILGDQPFLKHIVVAGTNSSAHPRLSDLMASAPTRFCGRADAPRRRLLLALFLRLHRNAQGSRACANQPDAHCRALCPADSWH